MKLPRVGRAFCRMAEDRKGAAAVEFSIISVVLVALLVGIVDFGRTLYVKNQMSFLADQAARSILINGSISDASLEAEIRAGFNAGEDTDLTVTFASDSVSGDDYRVVTIIYPVNLFIPNIAPELLTLTVVRRVPQG